MCIRSLRTRIRSLRTCIRKLGIGFTSVCTISLHPNAKQVYIRMQDKFKV